MMKRLNKTHIFHIFFGLLMFLPFISILSRVIYVQSNKNAKDSYSGNYEITYKYQSNEVNSVDDLVVGNIYQLNCEGKTISNLVQQGEYVYFELLSDLQFTNELTFEEVVENAITKFDSHMLLMFVDDTINIYSSQDDKVDYDYYLSFSYEDTFANNPIIRLLDYDLEYYTYYTYTDYNEIESVNLTGTLDNAFDYSISKFIEDNNFKINFFSWFEDLFLTQSGGVNALYLSFANWYMCYALLVSTGYLLFLILMWFINYVRKILEGGNSFGHGGF